MSKSNIKRDFMCRNEEKKSYKTLKTTEEEDVEYIFDPSVAELEMILDAFPASKSEFCMALGKSRTWFYSVLRVSGVVKQRYIQALFKVVGEDFARDELKRIRNKKCIYF